MEKFYEVFPNSSSLDYAEAVKPYLVEMYGSVRVPDMGRDTDHMFTYMSDTHIFSVKYMGMRKDACTRVLLAEDEVVAAGLMFLHKLKVMFVVGFSDANCVSHGRDRTCRSRGAQYVFHQHRGLDHSFGGDE